MDKSIKHTHSLEAYVHRLDTFLNTAEHDRQDREQPKALVYTYSSMMIQRLVYSQINTALQAGTCKSH